MNRSPAPLVSMRALAALLLALTAVACGGSQKPAAGPSGGKVPVVDGTVPPGGAVTGGDGSQSAVSDLPSSGESASDRPRMNGAALAAYRAGLQAFQAGDLDGAKAQFQKAVEADEKAYQAHYSLGVVRARLGDETGALAAYRKATGVVPDYEPAIVAYAVTLAAGGKGAEAESYLQELMARFPKSAAIPAALAEVKSIAGRSGEAQKLAQESLKRNPDYRPAMIVIARDHYRNRRLDLALYALKAVLDGFGEDNPPRDKDNAEARLLRGLIYREQGFRKGAMEELEAAVKLRPDLVEALVALGAYKLEAGNATEAVGHLESALRYDRANVMGRLNLGDAYRLLGRAADALRELNWVLSKDASLAQVHYNLGLLYLFAEGLPGLTPKQAAEKAIAEFEEYKKLRPRQAGPDDTDELIGRAKSKIALIDAKEEEERAKRNPPPAEAAPQEPPAEEPPP